jgi:hypothetical protein
MPYSLVVFDISVTNDEDDIKQELMQRYHGVLSVERWYFDSDENYPMSCIQVNFDSKENMDKILRNGQIIIGGICRRVSIVKQPTCYRCKNIGHKVHDCPREPLNEKDLINLFAEQKQ